MSTQESKGAAGATEQFINFMIGEEDFAIDLRYVREVIRCPEITRLPRAPYYVKGVIDLRGNIIPVIDMAARLGMSSSPMTALTSVIIVETEVRQIGAIVDRINQVIKLREDQITPPVRIAGGISEEYVRGVGRLEDQLIVILEATRVFTPRVAEELAGLAAAAPVADRNAE